MTKLGLISTSTYLSYLRTWLGLVAIMSFGNTFQCFRDHSFLGSRIYTLVAEDVDPLMARLFGMWTLLSASLRLYCAISIHNKGVYNLTLMSFVFAFGHFASEVFLYRTATFTVGILSPFIVSTLSITCMLIGYRYIDETPEITTEAEPDMMLLKKKKR